MDFGFVKFSASACTIVQLLNNLYYHTLIYKLVCKDNNKKDNCNTVAVKNVWLFSKGFIHLPVILSKNMSEPYIQEILSKTNFKQ